MAVAGAVVRFCCGRSLSAVVKLFKLRVRTGFRLMYNLLIHVQLGSGLDKALAIVAKYRLRLQSSGIFNLHRSTFGEYS